MELLRIGCFLCHVYADVRDTRGGSDPGLLSELGVTLLFYNCFRDTLQHWRHIGRIGGAFRIEFRLRRSREPCQVSRAGRFGCLRDPDPGVRGI